MCTGPSGVLADFPDFNRRMNMTDMTKPGKKAASHFYYENGRFHYSREVERKVFFFLTMAMLLSGIGVKLGLF